MTSAASGSKRCNDAGFIRLTWGWWGSLVRLPRIMNRFASDPNILLKGGGKARYKLLSWWLFYYIYNDIYIFVYNILLWGYDRLSLTQKAVHAYLTLSYHLHTRALFSIHPVSFLSASIFPLPLVSPAIAPSPYYWSSLLAHPRPPT